MENKAHRPEYFDILLFGVKRSRWHIQKKGYVKKLILEINAVKNSWLLIAALVIYKFILFLIYSLRFSGNEKAESL